MPAGQRVKKVFEQCGCPQAAPTKITRLEAAAMAAACSQRPGQGSGR